MSARGWGMLLVLCGAIFLEGIDVAMLNVALPSIRSDLGLATGELQWVMSAYVLGYGGFMLLGGRAADLFGRRRMFLTWLGVFLLFSGLGGLATEGWMLIAARFVTGVSAAFMTPAGLSIITTRFPEGPQRNRALLIYSGTAAGGFSLGLVIGGLLASISWRWVFFAPVVLSFLILISALALIPRAEHDREPDREPTETGRSRAGRVDVAGAVLVTGAILLLVLAVERAAHASAGRTAATLAAGFALVGAFVLVERRAAAPLVRLGILRSAALVRANLAGLLLAAAFFGFQFVAVLYLQELRGWSTMETSLAMLVLGIDAVLAPLLTPRLVERFGGTRVILGGLLIAALAYALFLPVGTDTVYLAMFPTMLLVGVSFALAYGPLTIAATDGIDESEQGLAGGLLYTSFQFGAALGLSLATAVNVAVAGEDSGHGPTPALLDGFQAALLVPLIAALLAAAVMATGLRRAARGGSVHGATRLAGDAPADAAAPATAGPAR
ncbi:MFS transporter [Streptomyces sp. DSM 44917]|uniref:MFS transporter n=1 Tax=Streptomyces boetiae TaxID=3075541 RepID=A0ABU2L730_9ACTN|nr:MFS transporter [Streptomyces sp. DSM 44917]MDT0307374.1 MFS transporter [Streptomyces sp. DSM 44917]